MGVPPRGTAARPDLEGPDGPPARILFRRRADRRRFLQAAAVVGVGAVLAPVTGRVPAARAQQEGASEVTLLSYGLTFEFLVCDFYERGLGADLFEGREAEIVQAVNRQQVANIEALSEAMVAQGENPLDKPAFSFPETSLATRDGWLGLASELEELGSSAWNGQFQILRTPEYLALAGPIVVNKGFASSVLAALAGRNAFPDVVVPPATIVDVLSQVEAYRGGQR